MGDGTGTLCAEGELDLTHLGTINEVNFCVEGNGVLNLSPQTTLSGITLSIQSQVSGVTGIWSVDYFPRIRF